MNEKLTSVSNCSACGGNHGIAFHQLPSAVEVDGEQYTHKGVCCNTDIEVFLTINTN